VVVVERQGCLATVDEQALDLIQVGTVALVAVVG
jgi:hypothetical protein